MRRWMRVFHDVRSGIMFGRRGAIALRCAIFVGILTTFIAGGDEVLAQGGPPAGPTGSSREQ